MARQSILDYLWHNAERRGHETAALSKVDGQLTPTSWGSFLARSQAISQALIRAGIEEGDRCAILLNTRLEWALIDMGIAGAGAVSVPIYASNLADECQFIGQDSGTKLIFCEDAQQTRKFAGSAQADGSPFAIVQLDGTIEPDVKASGHVQSFSEFLADVVPDQAELRRRKEALRRDAPFSIIYTSGTTGRPKGAISTHDNMLFEAEAIEQIEVLRPTDVELLILPLSHVFARALEIAWIGIGHVMAFADSIKSVREDMALCRPHVMAGVPRVFEKFYLGVMATTRKKGGLLYRALMRAAHVSHERGDAISQGKPIPRLLAFEHRFWQRTVFRRVGRGLKEIMGGRMRLLVSGGAPLSGSVAWFFHDAGVEILEGFGLTETMAATCLNRPGHNRIGTVGLPLPGMQAKLAADGELLMRGRSISPGYWQNKEATDEAIEDGWFKTGDIAQIEADGAIRIVDRKKDIIVTAGGKNVAPQNIENLFKTHRLVSQAVVHGDRRPYLTALVTLDAEALRAFADEFHLGNGSHAELSARPEVVRAIEEAVHEFNEQLPRYETVKKFRILPVDFTIESGELTPSLKVKRKLINTRYADVFNAFYAGP